MAVVDLRAFATKEATFGWKRRLIVSGMILAKIDKNTPAIVWTHDDSLRSLDQLDVID